MRASTPQRRGAAESDGNTSTSSRTTAGANLGDEALRLELERDKLVLVLERDKRMEARAARRVAYLRQRVDATRKRMGGYGALLYRTGPLGSIDVAGKAQRILERERDKLENRLCDTRSRHNKIQRENLDLKEQINGRRRARLSFQGVFSRIQADLQEAKRAIDRDTRLCHQNYAERDRAQLEMASLQQRVAAARRAYDEEWRRLTARLEEQQALATDQWDKAQGDGADRPGAVPHSPTRSAVKRVPKSDTWRSAWLLAKDATIADDSRMRKQDFAAKWERVRAETGAASLEEVLAGFRAAAEERYQHLRVTHQLETEIAALQREVRQMDAEIAHAKRAQSSQQAGDTTAASLQASIKQTQAAVRDSEEQRRSRLLGVAQVLQPLKQLLQHMGSEEERQLAERTGSSSLRAVHSIVGTVERFAQRMACAATMRAESAQASTAEVPSGSDVAAAAADSDAAGRATKMRLKGAAMPKPAFVPGPSTPSGRVRLHTELSRRKLLGLSLGTKPSGPHAPPTVPLPGLSSVVERRLSRQVEDSDPSRPLHHAEIISSLASLVGQ